MSYLPEVYEPSPAEMALAAKIMELETQIQNARSAEENPEPENPFSPRWSCVCDPFPSLWRFPSAIQKPEPIQVVPPPPVAVVSAPTAEIPPEIVTPPVVERPGDTSTGGSRKSRRRKGNRHKGNG
jgi:hypothetical protein